MKRVRRVDDEFIACDEIHKGDIVEVLMDVLKATDEELNKIIHEWMGLCYHEGMHKHMSGKCEKCQEYGVPDNPNYCRSMDALKPVLDRFVELPEADEYPLKVFAWARNHCEELARRILEMK